MSSKYRIIDHQALHFISFATVQWVDALSRAEYKDIFIESLKFCQARKGLILWAFVIMNNHVHLIASAKEGKNLSDILRDLKRFTSKALLGEIQNGAVESRRDWMLWIFKSAGIRNPNNWNFQFWHQDNHPIELSTNNMIDQRLEYLHENPVKAGIVYEARHYIYSSARIYAGLPGILEVRIIE